jgi:hypothetical protein
VGPTDVYLACSGSNWVPRNISQSPEVNSLVPRLALHPLWGPQVVWEERSRPHQVLYRQPGPAPNAVARGDVSAPAVAFEPHAAAGYADVHAVWEQVPDGTADGEPDIYYSQWRVDVPTPTPTPTITPSPTATAIPSRTPTPPTGTPPTATPTTTRGTLVPGVIYAPFVTK